VSQNPTALIIDDEPDIRELIALSLDRIGVDTHTAANLDEARHLLEAYTFDVCLTDMKLPDGDGVEFVKHVQNVQPALPVAVITAHGNMNAAVEAMKNGAFDFVSKPVDLKLLRRLVLQAVGSTDMLANKPGAPAANNDTFKSVADKALTEQTHASKNPDLITTLQQASTTASQRTESVSGARTEIFSETGSSLTMLSGRTNDDTSPHSEIGAGKLIGKSEPMRALRSMIAKVARTNAPVWITGESGTGKELIARLIHENSIRSDHPFIAINCGAIPSELMESEMFGHRKGSFTGAQADHDGLFKRAEGGTLFLDEVAELPLQMQVKLLRAIQERAVRPVGSTDEIDTDVRILSASHKDLNSEVTNGSFRHDLYYRLNVISIEAPSLRARCEDVPDISRHVLMNIALNDNNATPGLLSPDAETHLMAYQFPGNVRELENILERAMALSESTIIEMSDLNINLTADIAGHDSAMAITDNASLIKNTHAAERRLILDALENTRWNRKEAAKTLGMTYRQIRYRIAQYGIDDASGKG